MQLRHTDGGVACPTILLVSLPISDEIGCLTKPYSTSRLSRPLASYLLTLQKVYPIPLPKRGPSTFRRKYMQTNLYFISQFIELQISNSPRYNASKLLKLP